MSELNETLILAEHHGDEDKMDASARENYPNEGGEEQAAQKSPRKESPEKQRIPAKPLDEFYPDNYKAKELPDTQISRRNFAFHGVFGIPSMKRYNIHFLSSHEIIFVTGNKYQTYNIQT